MEANGAQVQAGRAPTGGAQKEQPAGYTEDRRAILLQELSKTNDEIKMRLEEGDRWYDYKFLIVGAFLAAFFGQFVFHNGTTEKRLEELLVSNMTSVALALACILALAIDIHLRADLNSVNEIGNWITYNAEPALLHQDFQEPSESSPQTSFVPWENFLRIKGAQHRNWLLSFVLWPHLHVLTWIIYIIYLTVFHNQVRRQHDPPKLSYDPQVLAWGGFGLVHITILYLAIESRSIPATFEFEGLGMGWAASAAIVLAGLNIFWALRPPKGEAGGEPKSKGVGAAAH